MGFPSVKDPPIQITANSTIITAKTFAMPLANVLPALAKYSFGVVGSDIFFLYPNAKHTGDRPRSGLASQRPAGASDTYC